MPSMVFVTKKSSRNDVCKNNLTCTSTLYIGRSVWTGLQAGGVWLVNVPFKPPPVLPNVKFDVNNLLAARFMLLIQVLAKAGMVARPKKLVAMGVRSPNK